MIRDENSMMSIIKKIIIANLWILIWVEDSIESSMITSRDNNLL